MLWVQQVAPICPPFKLIELARNKTRDRALQLADCLTVLCLIGL